MMPACRLFGEPWWSAHLGREQPAFWLAATSPVAMGALPVHARQGALNALKDCLARLGTRMQPFLPEVAAWVMCTLRCVTLADSQVRSHAAPASGQNLCSLGLTPAASAHFC